MSSQSHRESLRTGRGLSLQRFGLGVAVIAVLYCLPMLFVAFSGFDRRGCRPDTLVERIAVGAYDWFAAPALLVLYIREAQTWFGVTVGILAAGMCCGVIAMSCFFVLKTLWKKVAVADVSSTDERRSRHDP